MSYFTSIQKIINPKLSITNYIMNIVENINYFSTNVGTTGFHSPDLTIADEA